MENITAPQPVRLFLVGLSEGFARSLARYVGGDVRITLAGVAPSLAITGLLLATARADLLLLDWEALSGSVPEELGGLRASHPGMRIVCVANGSAPYRTAALQAGCDAMISRRGFAEEIEPLLKGFFPMQFSHLGDSLE